MRFSIKNALVVLALCAVTMTTVAHHSTNNIDSTKTVEVKGILTKVEFINPHTQFHLDASGKVSWTFEGQPPGWFRKAGIKRSEFDGGIGKEVTITGSPARDGSPFGSLRKVTFADGHSISF